MKNFKKFLTLVLAVMMVVSSVAFSTSAATTKFEDVSADNEALVKAVDLLNYVGVAKGTSETTFGSDELVTRQQFALFIYRLMKGGKDAPKAGNTTKFTDLEDNTYNFAIAWAVNEGIVTGRTTTTFAPKDPIKLQEAYAMVTRALGYEDEEELVYPFGHIDAAEKEGVALDANLAADLDYTDELTRGDMAIILYNAFFAETAEEKVEVKLEAIPGGGYNYKETTTHKTLCEEVFDVVEVELQAVATPYYYVGTNEPTYKLGNDSAVFEALPVAKSDLNADAGIGGKTYHLTAEELGLEADELDSYINGVFSMFVRLDKDKKIEKVLFADCNMVKKTVTKLELGTVSSNKAGSYFVDHNGKKTDAKILSGKLTADGVDMYLFNAPYTYIAPDYSKYDAQVGAGKTYATKDDAYFAARNENNLKKIDFVINRGGEEDVYQVVPSAANMVAASYDSTGFYTSASNAALGTFEMVYYGGLYEADLYDVEGDGIYDYIDYHEYEAFHVDSDSKKDFYASNGVATTRDAELIGYAEGYSYVYTNNATVIGEEFEDEDLVIGFYDKTSGIVKVAAVVEPVVDTIDNAKISGTVYLGSGDTVDGAGRWALLKKYAPTNNVKVYDAEAYRTSVFTDPNYKWFAPAEYGTEDEKELYIYDGVLLAMSGVSTNAKFEGDLIIPTTLGGQKPWDKGAFDPAADGQVYYVYAWVDGECQYVKVAYDKDLSLNIVDPNAVNLFNTNDFEDKLCTYTVKDGVYTILPLDKTVNDVKTTAVVNMGLPVVVSKNATDANLVKYLGKDKADNKGDAGAQVFSTYGKTTPVTLVKDNGTRFNLMEWNADPTKVTVDLFTRDLVLSPETKIIIKVRDDNKTPNVATDDEYKYEVYNSENFTKSLDAATVLKNVSVVVANNADSYTREDLVLLYAETDSLEFKGVTDKTGYRIVADYELDKDDEGEWRIFYNVINPFTGAKESKVPSYETEKEAKYLNSSIVPAGTVVKLTDGKVKSDNPANKAALSEAADINAKKLAWITEVDTKENYFTVVPYAKGLADDFAAENHAITKEKTHVFDIFGKEIMSNVIGFNDDTVVAVVTKETYDANFWRWNDGITTSSMEAIAELDTAVVSSIEVLNQTSKEYETFYSKFVKAYIAVDENNPKEDEIPVAEFIIVVVNEDETAAKEYVPPVANV